MVLSTCTSATFASWATDVTKCTNPTFDKVLTSNWSNFKAQQDVLTVLRAVTKVIQDRGGSESSTEYYASLLTALNTPSEMKAAESFLLKLVFKSLPDSVLRSTFGEASKIIVHALNMCLSSGSDDVPQIKSLLVCLGHLLCAQSPDSWSIESVRHMYRHLLRFVDHEKPAIRKAIHVSVHNILNVNQVNLETSRFHPACHQTVEHLCSIVKQQSRQLIAVLCTQDNHCTRLLHCVELLTSILHLLPPKEVKTACECILELVEFPNSLVVAKSYDCFRVLFDNRPSFSLPLDLAARLLTALHSFRPNDPAVLDVSGGSSTSTGGFTGVDVMISWCKAIRSGCTYLCELSCESIESSVTHSRASDPSSADPQNVATEHMDKLLKCFLDILITTPLPNLKDTVAKMMDDLMVNQLGCDLVRAGLQERAAPLLRSTATRLDDSLQVKHCDSWVPLLRLISRLLRVWPNVFVSTLASDIPRDLIRHVVKLRDSFADGPQGLTDLLQANTLHRPGLPADLSRLGDSIVDEMNRVCLVALESLGPECILDTELLSLESLIEELEQGAVDLRRSWLLPLLARAQPMRPCRLSFFSQNLIPLADRALDVVTKAASSKSSGTPHTTLITAAIAIVKQLWAGLAMCVRHPPPDWSELSTGGLGRRLIKELTSTPALRATVLLAFRRLSLLAQHSDEGLTTMCKGAKLSVPAMLSLYENAELPEESALRQQIRATLSAYLPCLTCKMVSAPAKLAYQKLTATQNPVYLEILQILVPHTRAEEISSFLTNLNDYFTSSSRTLQKRAYRLLELVCLGSTASSKEYLKEHLNQLLCWLHSLAGTVTRTSGFDAPLDVPSKEDLSGSSDAPDLFSHLAKLSFVGSNVATDHHLVKGNKRARTNVPWKPRIRCLHHLLIQLVTQEQEVISDPSTALENPRLREFANMFLPEILAAVCEANRVVRTLAYRLVVQLTLAFAGRAAEASSNIPASDVGSGIFRSTRNYKQVLPTGDETDDDNSSIGGSDGTSVGQPSSLGRFTCADGDDLRSTRSIASPMCLNICSALHLMLSRLWGCLPPQASVASNRGELVAQESAGRVMCHLLKHLRFRRSLLLVLESDDDEGAQTRVHASAILNNAHIISQLLIRSPQRPFARLGLQLVRLLLAFVGFSSISLTDLVQSLQSLHSIQKRPLRFAVKAILEKMVKRFGRKTLQGMMTPEYAKVVRNSARTMARLERRRTALPTANERTNKALSAAGSVSLKASTSAVNSHRKDVRSISGRTHLSLPPRVHIPSFEELLVASSDEEIPITQRATSVRSAVSDKRSKKSVASALGPKSLAEELESLAETAGLCQRSRKRMLRGRGSVNDSDGSDDDGVEVDGRTFATIDTKRKGIRRGVRFADTTSMISDSVPKRKRSRVISEGSGTPGLWLVEQPDTDDIIDLSDPKALARHTAFTTDAKTARAAANALRKITAKQSVSTTFPIVDGKILIDGGERTTRGATQEIDWGELSSDDDGNNLNATGTWSDYRTPTKTKGKRSAVKSIPGRIYASSKAEGDMRRAGQPEPYAYVALGSGLGARGKTASTAERRRLLKAVGVGKHKRNKLKVGLGSAAKKGKPRHTKS